MQTFLFFSPDRNGNPTLFQRGLERIAGLASKKKEKNF
jgi:hypothetical protein